MPLRRSSSVPLYAQIKDWVKGKIDDGAWPPHHQLPAEQLLARELGVALGTMRQALGQLVNEGVLYRQHGVGTFVAGRIPEQWLTGRLVFFPEELSAQGVAVTNQVVWRRVEPASPEVAQVLSLSPDARVFRLRRVRSVPAGPVMVVDNTFDYGICPGIETEDLTEQVLGHLLEERYGVTIDSAVREVEPVGADSEVARLLEVKRGTHLLRTSQITFRNGDIPFESATMWLRTDRFKLRMVLKR